MRSITATISGLILLASLAFAGSGQQATLRCTLTGKTIQKCCCEKKDGKLYCTLAKKTIDKCCCELAQSKK